MDTAVIVILISEALLCLVLLWKEGLIGSPYRFFIAVCAVGLAFLLRSCVLDYRTLDYRDFLSRWVEFFRLNGGFAALEKPVGNYNIPYLYFLALFSYSDINDLYLIKCLSFLFDVLLAYASMKLLSRFTESRGRLLACFLTVLFLPTVFLNSAVWAQCDSMYVSLALLGIYCAMDDRPVPAMILAALSFGVKLQAVFILPVYAVLWMQGKLKLRHFLIFPLSYVILVLPAVIAGRPFTDTVLLYLSQTGSIGGGLSYNSPSLFALFGNIENTALASKLAVVAAFIYMFLVLAAAWTQRESLSDESVMWAGFLLALGIPFLLPHMHERYFFACDIFALLLSFALPRLSAAAVLGQFASLLGYHAYLKRKYFLPMSYGSAALILLMITGFFGYYGSLSGKNFKFSQKSA